LVLGNKNDLPESANLDSIIETLYVTKAGERQEVEERRGEEEMARRGEEWQGKGRWRKREGKEPVGRQKTTCQNQLIYYNY
jgi:hypothetical protein